MAGYIHNIEVNISNNSLPLQLLECNQSSSFFDTYFSQPRFWLETAAASISGVTNLLALLSSANARNQRFSIYHTLFINLCIANILNSCLSWLSNNILFLFHEHLVQMMMWRNGVCKVFTFLTATLFVCTGFSVVSILTLLGFITVQYFAICRPLHHLVHKKWVIIFIWMSWVITLLVSCIPFIVLILYTTEETCDAELLKTIFRLVIIGADCCISLVTIIYLVVLATCMRIYWEIRNHQIRLSQFRYTQDVKPEQRAFVTTLLLMATLTLFFIPYTTVYIVSLHESHGHYINNQVIIYYMNILPYIKFLSDPLIYGMRMREIREGCVRFGISCGCHMYCNTGNEGYALSQAEYVTSSLRVRHSLDGDPNISVHLNLQHGSCRLHLRNEPR